jgi:nucleotide-binding universal stress UspA family protein
MSMTTILVPTDFSERSLAAVAYAFKLAQRLGATAHLLHAYSTDVTPEQAGYGSLPAESLRREVLERMREVAAPYERLSSFAEPIVIVDDPKLAILETAASLKADLIVLGTQSRRGLERLLLGSVAEHVVRESVCPALVVKAGVWEP